MGHLAPIHKVKSDLTLLSICVTDSVNLSVPQRLSASLNSTEKALPDAQEILGKNRHIYLQRAV